MATDLHHGPAPAGGPPAPAREPRAVPCVTAAVRLGQARQAPGALNFVLGLALVLVWLPGLEAGAAAVAPENPPPTSREETQGPKALKQQTRVTVQTNVISDAALTNKTLVKPKSFSWKTTWKNWDGLHYAVQRRTLLGDPLAGLRQTVEGTNTIQVFHLEEVKMKGKLGGKLALDAAVFPRTDDIAGFDNGAELRRARIYGKGDCLLLLPVSYELELGYVPNGFYIEQSYLAFEGVPGLGELKVGQYQAPMALDVMTSSRDIPFMETAAPLQALAPGVNAGIQFGRPVLGERATWRFGVFTDGVGQDFGDASRDYARAVTRFTGLPIDHLDADEPAATRLLHVGVSANVLYSGSSSIQYRARPENHLAPYLVDTGTIAAAGALVAGTEVAWVQGPFSAQAEYLHSWVTEAAGQTPEFDGVYACASWFLTGESRPYIPSQGQFGRVVPARNFTGRSGGWGAWELAARYSFVNLNSEGIQGGRLSLGMLGLNWYLHPNVKWRFDWGFGQVEGHAPSGSFSLIATRMEIDF